MPEFGGGSASYVLNAQVQSSGISQFQDSISGAASSVGSLKSAVGTAGAALAAVSAGGIAAATSAAADFESQMADVQKVTSEAVSAQLKEDILDLSNSIPIAHGELATLAEQAGKFGVEGSQNIRKFVKTVGEITSATDLAAEEAGKRFAKIAGAVGLPMSQIDKLGNAVNSLADSMKTDAAEVTDTATRTANVLSQQFGLGEDAVLAMSASMNEVSSSSRLAAGHLKRAAESLMDPKKVMDISGALGMQVDQFRKMRKQSPQKLMELVAKRMKEGGESAQDLSVALGTQATRAFSLMGSQLGATEKAQQQVNQQFKNGTSLQKEMAIRTNTAAGQWKLFKNRIRGAAIQVGDQFLPIAKRMLGGLNQLVGIIGRFNERTDGMAGAITLVAGLLGGTITAIGAFSGALSASATASAAAGGAWAALGTTLTALAGPVGIAAAAIAGLAAAWMTDFAGIRTATMDVVKVIRQEFGPIIHGIGSAIQSVFPPARNTVTRFASKASTALRPVVSLLRDSLIAGIRALAQVTRTSISAATNLWERHRGSVTRVLRILRNAVRTVAGAIGTALSGITGSSRRMSTGVRSALRPLEPVVRGLGRVFQDASDTARGAFNVVRRVVSAVAPVVARLVRQYFSVVLDVAERVFAGVQNAVQTAMPVVQRVVRTYLSTVGQLWRQVIIPLYDITSRTFNRIRKAVASAMQWIWGNAIRPMLTRIMSLWERHGNAIVSETLQTWRVVRDSITNVLSAIWTGVIRPILNRIQAFWSAHGDSILRVTRRVFGVIQDVITTILDGIRVFWNRWGSEILSVARHIWTTIREVISVAIDGIATGIRVTLAVIRGDWGEAWNLILGFLERTWNSIETVVRSAWNVLTGIVDQLTTDIRDAFQWLYNVLIGNSIVPEMLAAIHNRFVQFITNTLGRITAWIQTTISKFRTFGSTLINTANRKLKALHDRFAQTFRNVRNRLFAWAGTLQNRFRNMGTFFLNTANRKLKALHDRFAQMFATVRSRFFGWTSTLRRRLGGVLTRMRRMAGRWVSHFTRPFRNAKDRVLSEFNELKRRVVGNSIVPDMLSETVRESDRWVRPFTKPFRDAKSRAIREFKELKRKIAQKSAEAGEAATNKFKTNLSGEARKTFEKMWSDKFLFNAPEFKQSHLKAGLRGKSGFFGDYQNKNNMGATLAALSREGLGIGKDRARKRFEKIWAREGDAYDAMSAFINSGSTPFEMASGGIVTRATNAIVGEAGPEAVVPLDKLPKLLAKASQEAGTDQQAGQTVEINIENINASGRREGRESAKAIRSELRSGNF